MFKTFEEAKKEQERLYRKTGKQWSIHYRWEPDELGYTVKKDLAGRYTFERACEIVKESNRFSKNKPMEMMVKDEQR